MGLDWDRLTTHMIREMIRQFRRQPSEFLTFRHLAIQIRGADRELSPEEYSTLLHAIAELRKDLFIITDDGDGEAVKLYFEAVERIDRVGVEEAISEPGPVPMTDYSRRGHQRCDHFSEEEMLTDLRRCSPPPQALTEPCCWGEITRLRGLHPRLIDDECWRELCATRGYLLKRQNRF